MKDGNVKKIDAVCGKTNIPVIIRKGKGCQLQIRLPYSKNNREFLQNGKRTNPEWKGIDKYWETPKAWFNELVERILRKYQRLYIVQPYRRQETCAPACMNALGHKCECSYMGANHGAGVDDGWFSVSDSFAIRWGETEMACRLMENK